MDRMAPHSPYPTRQQAGAYERNERAFGPAAATVIGLVDAAGRGATDIGKGFGEVLGAVQDAADQVGRVSRQATGLVAEAASDAAEQTADAVGAAATWLGDGVVDVASDLAVLALLVSAGLATGGTGAST